jgi:hypothetical protein
MATATRMMTPSGWTHKFANNSTKNDETPRKYRGVFWLIFWQTAIIEPRKV